jgi:hypothetical protein
MSAAVVAAGTYRLECGCVALVERQRWVTMCPTHEADYQATRERWLRERAEPFVPTIRCFNGVEQSVTDTAKETVMS